MSPVRTCDYTGIFARMGLVFQSLPNGMPKYRWGRKGWVLVEKESHQTGCD